MAAPIPRLAPVTNATLRSCVMQFFLPPPKWHLMHPQDDFYCPVEMLFRYWVNASQDWQGHCPDHIQLHIAHLGLAGIAWSWSIAQIDTIVQSMPDVTLPHPLRFPR